MKKLILILSFLAVGGFSYAANEAVKKEPAKAAKKDTKKEVKGDDIKPEPSERKSASSDEARPLLPTHFEKGWKVEVMDYDAKSDIFELAVKGSGEEEAGPFYFTVSEVLKGRGENEDPKSMSLQKKKDLVGAEFELKEDIKILTFEEYIQNGGDPNTF